MTLKPFRNLMKFAAVLLSIPLAQASKICTESDTWPQLDVKAEYWFLKAEQSGDTKESHARGRECIQLMKPIYDGICFKNDKLRKFFREKRTQYFMGKDEH